MKHFFPIVGNQLISLLLGLASAKLITWLVPPAVNGIYQVKFVPLTTLGILLTHPGVINHTLRYWQREKPQSGQYARFLWRTCWVRFKYLLPILLGICLFFCFSDRPTTWALALPLLLACNLF